MATTHIRNFRIDQRVPSEFRIHIAPKKVDPPGRQRGQWVREASMRKNIGTATVASSSRKRKRAAAAAAKKENRGKGFKKEEKYENKLAKEKGGTAKGTMRGGVRRRWSLGGMVRGAGGTKWGEQVGGGYKGCKC